MEEEMTMAQSPFELDPMNPMLTTDEVAEYLRVDVVTIRRLITKGELGAYRIASEYRVRQSDLAAYLKRQYIPPKPAPDAAEPVE
jgi:excisionase family DNA binding protein